MILTFKLNNSYWIKNLHNHSLNTNELKWYYLSIGPTPMMNYYTPYFYDYDYDWPFK
jgi:hypothetical protein